MIKTEVVDHIAHELYKAERDGVEVDKFVDQFSELDSELAYEVQDRLIGKKCREENTRISGRKLGLTSRAKQEMMGVHEPTYGVLLENMQLLEGAPISMRPFIHAKIEPEIAFIFDKEVKGPTVSVTDILAATAYIAPAMEIIDSRFRNFNFTLPDVVADNSSSSRYMIGEKLYRVDNVDLRLMGMVFRKNGEILATSAGASVMGHPARAIAWMANKLVKKGQSIKAGEVVLSGALSGAATISPGDHFSVSFDGIGSLEASFSNN
ncbi:4-oxalocrotonate decarboxylase [Peribacillus cavernae]|uniref:4-oxalocrotonate decarboxylase n=1 Tax=Peribacillus cavernae TaxID=1674310 RepID=A0A433HWV6_9BACI|nr:fumarylacetoacetate hydrolase family protein [Peribacillus cavernae]MDQ0218024.1 2-oxo-3-hexenedioate decarboxylase [Peribacillus cavernae]RUQ32810.1 4-oxalocrotonate decarboxylase [Peribacillus cavernae]